MRATPTDIGRGADSPVPVSRRASKTLVPPSPLEEFNIPGRPRSLNSKTAIRGSRTLTSDDTNLTTATNAATAATSTTAYSTVDSSAAVPSAISAAEDNNDKKEPSLTLSDVSSSPTTKIVGGGKRVNPPSSNDSVALMPEKASEPSVPLSTTASAAQSIGTSASGSEVLKSESAQAVPKIAIESKPNTSDATYMQPVNQTSEKPMVKKNPPVDSEQNRKAEGMKSEPREQQKHIDDYEAQLMEEVKKQRQASGFVSIQDDVPLSQASTIRGLFSSEYHQSLPFLILLNVRK